MHGTLQPVHPLVCPSVRQTYFFLLFRRLLHHCCCPKCMVTLFHHCPCPPAGNLAVYPALFVSLPRLTQPHVTLLVLVFYVADTQLYTLPCRSVSQSVGPLVPYIFELRAVFTLRPLPNCPRLSCRVSGLGLISQHSDQQRPGFFFPFVILG